MAAAANNPTAIQSALENGARLCEAYLDGNSALMIAASAGSKEAVMHLLAVGANAFEMNEQGANARDFANDLEIVDILSQWMANQNSLDRLKDTPVAPQPFGVQDVS